MDTTTNFIDSELSEIEDLPIFSKRPESISIEKWYKAIDEELEAWFYDHYDQISKLKKWHKKYSSQRDFMLLALHSINFAICPSVFVDNNGQIYFLQSEESWFIPFCVSDGSLGFVGNGNVCIITPIIIPSKSILRVIYHNLNTKDSDFYDIQKSEIEEAHKSKRRIQIRDI